MTSVSKQNGATSAIDHSFVSSSDPATYTKQQSNNFSRSRSLLRSLSSSSGLKQYDLQYHSWPYQARSSTDMKQRSDGTWVNSEVEIMLEGSPPARTNMVACLEWLIEQTGAEQECLGSRHLNPDGSFGSIQFRDRGDLLRKSLLLAEGFSHEIDEIAPAHTFEDMSYLNNDDATLKRIRCLGIAMQNCPEFMYMELVAQLLGIVLVPIYGTLGAEAMSVIIEETKLSTMVVDPQTLRKMLDSWNIKDCNLGFPHIILSYSENDMVEWDYYKCNEMVAEIKVLGSTVSFLDDYEAEHQLTREKRYQWKPEELWTLSYTSGTTGRPKGAMLNMQALMTVTQDIIYTFITDRGISQSANYYPPTYFSYLPLAHILERSCINAVLCLGHRVAFFSGTVLNLFEEVKEAGTTLLMCVPRVLERLQMKIIESLHAKGGIIKYIFNKALSKKVENHQKSSSVTHGVWDAAIMKKIKAQVVGPQLQAIICGGAPLSTRIREDVQAMLSCKVLIGYGLTETCGACFVQHTADVQNAIGWVMKSAEAKLIDVPELEYFSKDNKGELLVRGYGLFSGYFRQPELTRAAFTEDGWFRTGDVCHFDTSAGGCAVIDRAKNCFKLAQGEYIAPEKIENVLKVAPSIDQVVVCGNATETCCVAIVSISEGFVESSGRSASDLIRDPLVQSNLVQEMTLKAKESKLFGFEIPKHFVFIHRAIMPDDGLHTPTLKVKRPVFHKKFEHCIDYLYKEKRNIAIDIDAFINGTGSLMSSILC